jgi:glycosyltransferase involved in cell wall biosynthesis
MGKNIFDISVILTAHREGCLAHHSMNSVFRTIDYSRKYDIETEVIVILDRPDKPTSIYFSRYKNSDILIEQTDFGDPGLSRNHGVTCSSGKYIAFLDADDLFGKTWLKAAYEQAQKIDEYKVFHPEYVVCFGQENYLVKNKSIDDKEFFLGNMLEYNCWNSVHFFTEKALLLENPFIKTPNDSGFGYEDWHWNCEVIAKGIQITVVPETCVFYRKKNEGSRLNSHDQNKVLIPPSKLFDPALFSTMLQEEKITKQNKRADCE